MEWWWRRCIFVVLRGKLLHGTLHFVTKRHSYSEILASLEQNMQVTCTRTQLHVLYQTLHPTARALSDLALSSNHRIRCNPCLVLLKRVQAEIISLKSQARRCPCNPLHCRPSVTLATQLRLYQTGTSSSGAAAGAGGRRMSVELLGDSGGTRRRSLGGGDDDRLRLDVQRELDRMQVCEWAW